MNGFSRKHFKLSSLLCGFQDLNKRLSLPADIRIPDGYLEKLQLSSPPFDQPLSRRSRRASLVSVCVSTCQCVCVLQPALHRSAAAAAAATAILPSVPVTMATGPSVGPELITLTSCTFSPSNQITQLSCCVSVPHYYRLSTIRRSVLMLELCQH